MSHLFIKKGKKVFFKLLRNINDQYIKSGIWKDPKSFNKREVQGNEDEEQSGFRVERTCTVNMFCLKQLFERM